MLEYHNPHSTELRLLGPDGHLVRIGAKARVTLSEWYVDRYVPKYLRVVGKADGRPAPIRLPTHGISKFTKIIPKVQTPLPKSLAILPPAPPPRPAAVTPRPKLIAPKPRIETKSPTVGRGTRHGTHEIWRSSIPGRNFRPYSEIGVGILSFNRLNCIQRLLSSIRRFTDLQRITVFVSDESTDPVVRDWLRNQNDIVVLTDQPQLGIAGNTNRLLNCLERFQYGILLNDDVEVLASGWEDFYVMAHKATGYHHFCFRQPGIYGATAADGIQTSLNGKTISTIPTKPHGAILFFTRQAFKKVGYFDDGFGIYGCEHVDWSTRINRAGLQPDGFHDVIGASNFFRINREASSVNGKRAAFTQAKEHLQRVRQDHHRIFVPAKSASDVPSITVVLPFRDFVRSITLVSVIRNMQAQLFPRINIVVVEHDTTPHLSPESIWPAVRHFCPTARPNQPFNKSLAFNLGVSKSPDEYLVLHDADILCEAGYVDTIYKKLAKFESAHVGLKVLYLDQSSSASLVAGHPLIEQNCIHVVNYFEGGSIAIRKSTFYRIGGFNEEFEGYGFEDCDFFRRAKDLTLLSNNRSEVFVHLYHERDKTNWDAHHSRNRAVSDKTRSQAIGEYVESLRALLNSRYHKQ